MISAITYRLCVQFLICSMLLALCSASSVDFIKGHNYAGEYMVTKYPRGHPHNSLCSIGNYHLNQVTLLPAKSPRLKVVFLRELTTGAIQQRTAE